MRWRDHEFVQLHAPFVLLSLLYLLYLSRCVTYKLSAMVDGKKRKPCCIKWMEDSAYPFVRNLDDKEKLKMKKVILLTLVLGIPLGASDVMSWNPLRICRKDSLENVVIAGNSRTGFAATTSFVKAYENWWWNSNTDKLPTLDKHYRNGTYLPTQLTNKLLIVRDLRGEYQTVNNILCHAFHGSGWESQCDRTTTHGFNKKDQKHYHSAYDSSHTNGYNYCWPNTPGSGDQHRLLFGMDYQYDGCYDRVTRSWAMRYENTECSNVY